MKRSLEIAALFILLVVVGLRPLVGEVYDTAAEVVSAADGLASASPVRTLLFDMAILVAGGLWLWGQAMGPSAARRRTGLGWGLGLIAIACVVSCIGASNRRVAINASFDFVCIGLLAVIGAQVLRSRWHRRLLLSVVLASACAQALQCANYVYIEHAETRDDYYARKAEFWSAQGVSLDSSKVKLFEGRLASCEAAGFLSHANVAGSLLAMCGLVGIGMTAQGLRRRSSDSGGWPLLGCAAACVLIFWAMWLTKSRGAILAFFGAAGLGGLLIWQRGWVDVHRRRVLVIGWLVALVGLLAVAGLTRSQRNAVGSSMGFRWHYWATSSELIADHPFAGVGRGNFGRHYLAYKDITSPEEVSNPHNLFVQAAADWGLLGLSGLVVMLVGGAVQMARPPRADNHGEREPAIRPVHILGWMTAIGAAILLLRIPLLPSDDPHYIYYMSVLFVVPWCAGFACFAWLGHRPAGDGDAFVHTGLAVGVLAFLVHELINFALFVPGSATTLAALVACGLSARGAEADREGPDRLRWVKPIGVAVVAALSLAYVVLPVYQVAGVIETCRRAPLVPGGLADQVAWEPLREAMAADRLDPLPAVATAEYAMALAEPFHGQSLSIAIPAAQEAVRRDPASVAHRRLLHRACEAWARHRGGAEYWGEAIAAARAALALYPEDPAGLVRLAETLCAGGEAIGTRSWLVEAADTYAKALALDDQRLDWETMRRFDARRIAAIESEIARIRALLAA